MYNKVNKFFNILGIFLKNFVAFVVVISQIRPNQRNLRAAWHIYGLTKTDIQYAMLAFVWTIFHCMSIIE